LKQDIVCVIAIWRAEIGWHVILHRRLRETSLPRVEPRRRKRCSERWRFKKAFARR